MNSLIMKYSGRGSRAIWSMEAPGWVFMSQPTTTRIHTGHGSSISSAEPSFITTAGRLSPRSSLSTTQGIRLRIVFHRIIPRLSMNGMDGGPTRARTRMSRYWSRWIRLISRWARRTFCAVGTYRSFGPTHAIACSTSIWGMVTRTLLRPCRIAYSKMPFCGWARKCPASADEDCRKAHEHSTPMSCRIPHPRGGSPAKQHGGRPLDYAVGGTYTDGDVSDTGGRLTADKNRRTSGPGDQSADMRYRRSTRRHHRADMHVHQSC